MAVIGQLKTVTREIEAIRAQIKRHKEKTGLPFNEIITKGTDGDNTRILEHRRVISPGNYEFLPKGETNEPTTD